MRAGRRAWLTGALALTAGRALAGPVTAIGEALFPGVLFSGPADVPALALTIDDGPDPATTPAILDALDAAGARATFMLI
ncbi:MAG TPA: polysaccharide deacetylase family protein, partial [Candidatus Limnocylindrales bacterium]|nr:polysaccharide deacetylase family protein [Candidatus Limnocylindrales bacterium]